MRQMNTLLAPREQLAIEFAFELRYLFGERWLHDVKALGGAPKIFFFGGRPGPAARRPHGTGSSGRVALGPPPPAGTPKAGPG